MSNDLFLKTQMKRLSVLKGAPQERDACAAWMDTADPILQRIGEQRFQATVAKCIETLQFFPMPATFRELVVPETRQRTQGNCNHCDESSGYTMRERYHHWRNGAVTRETYADPCEYCNPIKAEQARQRNAARIS